MTKTMILVLGMGLLETGCLGGDQPGPIANEPADCESRWHLAEVFTPPVPTAGELPECLMVVALNHTSLLRGSDRSACDANLGNPPRVLVRWPESVSVFHYQGHEAEFSVESCE